MPMAASRAARASTPIFSCCSTRISTAAWSSSPDYCSSSCARSISPSRRRYLSLAIGFPVAWYIVCQRRAPAPAAHAGHAAVLDQHADPHLLLDPDPARRGPDQQFPSLDGLHHAPTAAALQSGRDPARPRLYLPALHGAADLRDAGAARSPAHRGGLRPLRQPLVQCSAASSGRWPGPAIAAGPCWSSRPRSAPSCSPTCSAAASSCCIGSLIEMQFTSSRNWPFGAALSILVTAVVASSSGTATPQAAAGDKHERASMQAPS